jgi:hypothetical protein
VRGQGSITRQWGHEPSTKATTRRLQAGQMFFGTKGEPGKIYREGRHGRTVNKTRIQRATGKYFQTRKTKVARVRSEGDRPLEVAVGRYARAN